jgi:hypothetical protein
VRDVILIRFIIFYHTKLSWTLFSSNLRSNNSDNLTGYIYFFFIKQRHIFIHTNTQVYIYKINMIGTLESITTSYRTSICF